MEKGYGKVSLDGKDHGARVTPAMKMAVFEELVYSSSWRFTVGISWRWWYREDHLCKTPFDW
jgi:hypothetical protein